MASHETYATPEKRSVKEISAEVVREAFEKIKNIASKQGRSLGMVLLMMTLERSQHHSLQNQQDNVADVSEKVPVQSSNNIDSASGNQLFTEETYEKDAGLDDAQVLAIRKMIEEMPEDFSDFREEILAQVYDAKRKFNNEASHSAQLIYQEASNIEYWNGKQIINDVDASEALIPTEAEGVDVRLFSTFNSLTNSVGAQSEHMLNNWQEMETIVQIYKHIAEENEDPESSAEKFNIIGIGNDENSALLHALENAAKKMNKVKRSEPQKDSFDGGGIVRSYTGTILDARIKHYKVIKTQETGGIYDGKRAISVEIEVIPEDVDVSRSISQATISA